MPAKLPAARYIPIYDPLTSKLLFRFDPSRGLIEYQDRHRCQCFDLAALVEAASKVQEERDAEIQRRAGEHHD